MNSQQLTVWNQAQERLRNFVFRYTNDKALTDDIVHDVFIKVHDKLDQLRDSDKIGAWIFRIAKNTITDYYRGNAKARKPGDTPTNNNDFNMNDCVAACLGEMMQTIPGKYREALELSALNRIPQTDLAKKLKISYSGAKSRVQRAKKMLRENVQKAYGLQFDSYGNAVACAKTLPCGCN